MPLLRVPTTEELEDHFFGSGAFQYGWFFMKSVYNYEKHEAHFPALVVEVEEGTQLPIGEPKEITEEIFIEGIKKYAESLSDRSFDDLIEDMDAVDVNNVIQLIMFGEIRYS